MSEPTQFLPGTGRGTAPRSGVVEGPPSQTAVFDRRLSTISAKWSPFPYRGGF